MFMFLMLLAIVSFATAAPGYLYGGYGVPAATSYSSRIDYQTPVIAKTVVAAPVISTYGHGLGYSGLYGGLGYGYGNGLVYDHDLGYGHGLSYGQGLGYGHGLGLGHGYGHVY